jgi:hypothetical protein
VFAVVGVEMLQGNTSLVPASGFEILPGVYLLYTIFNPSYILVSYQPKISLEPVPRPFLYIKATMVSVCPGPETQIPKKTHTF